MQPQLHTVLGDPSGGEAWTSGGPGSGGTGRNGQRAGSAKPRLSWEVIFGVAFALAVVAAIAINTWQTNQRARTMESGGAESTAATAQNGGRGDLGGSGAGGSSGSDSKGTGPNGAGSRGAGSAEQSLLPEFVEPGARKVVGVERMLGPGTFVVGADLAPGLYDVTSGGGQSGNVIVNDGAVYNEVLDGGGSGFGISQLRVRLAEGDAVHISALAWVGFKPVVTPYETSHVPMQLSAGSFVVGEDLGAGRYVVRPPNGQSGRIVVSGSQPYDRLLDGTGRALGPADVTMELSSGADVQISGMSGVSFTPIP